MAETFTMAEADALLETLDECWKKVVRAADESDAEDIYELIEIVRPQFRGGDRLASTLFDIGFCRFGWSNSKKGACGIFLTAFGYVAGLKLSLERGSVPRESALARGAVEHTQAAYDRILVSGPRERSAKAANGGRRKFAKVYGADESAVCQLLASNADGWESIEAAVKWVCDELDQRPDVTLSFDNRPVKVREWITKHPAVKAAFDSNRRCA